MDAEDVRSELMSRGYLLDFDSCFWVKEYRDMSHGLKRIESGWLTVETRDQQYNMAEIEDEDMTDYLAGKSVFMTGEGCEGEGTIPAWTLGE